MTLIIFFWGKEDLFGGELNHPTGLRTRCLTEPPPSRDPPHLGLYFCVYFRQLLNLCEVSSHFAQGFSLDFPQWVGVGALLNVGSRSTRNFALSTTSLSDLLHGVTTASTVWLLISIFSSLAFSGVSSIFESDQWISRSSLSNAAAASGLSSSPSSPP